MVNIGFEPTTTAATAVFDDMQPKLFDPVIAYELLTKGLTVCDPLE